MSRIKYSGFTKNKAEKKSRIGVLSNDEAQRLIDMEKRFNYDTEIEYRIPAFGDEEYPYKVVADDCEQDIEQKFTNTVWCGGYSEEEAKFSVQLIHDYTNTKLLRIDVGNHLPKHRNIISNETIEGAHLHIYRKEDWDYAENVSNIFPNLMLNNKVAVAKEFLKHANISLDNVIFEEKLL